VAQRPAAEQDRWTDLKNMAIDKQKPFVVRIAVYFFSSGLLQG